MDSAYLEDASGYRGHAEAVFAPPDEAGVAAVVRDAAARGVPVTIAGAGTGITGARVPFGGWVLSLEKLRAVEMGMDVAGVGAGALLRDVQAAAAASGQFYPPDPTETGAAVGGTIATNASGSRSFRYGATRRWVEALRVVMADGTVREFRRGQPLDFPVPEIHLPAVTKNTAGYLLRPGMDWVDLFVGSEGTLGVITWAELRLLPAPADLLAGVVFFPSGSDAVDAADTWRAEPRPRMIEYFDRPSLDLLRERFPDIPPAAAAAVLIEDERDAEFWIERLENSPALLDDSWFADNPRDRERFRQFRHALPELVNDIIRRRNVLKMNSDYAVPAEHNRAMMDFYRARLEAEFPGQYVIFGHIGDAHVHVNILCDGAGDQERASGLLLELARRAVALGGTVSAEHGLGKRKAHLLALQYSPEELAAMRAVKDRLDPQWLLGRGTLWAAPQSTPGGRPEPEPRS